MATIKKFEELKCWQTARELAREVYACTREGSFAKDYGLKDQMQRAVVSIGSNIAEGFERDSGSELVKFLGYAKGSAGELRSQLYTAFDVGYLTEEMFMALSEKSSYVAALISRFRDSVKRSQVSGLRNKDAVR